ncbi:hypothetical protein DL96DRAFT_1706278 [Flagelloscypha sp. PMI_526]|nr:hypothetical protein DL96DRAFT_1706278 [Flagelloscypha sp. PMI_526]
MSHIRASSRSYNTSDDLAIQQSLEKEIRSMERKIKQLERQREEGDPYVGEPIHLHVPYRAMTDSPRDPFYSDDQRTVMGDEKILARYFLQHSDQFALFLHPTRFWQAALDESSGQTPFLRFCALLCGAAIARGPNLSGLLYKALKQRASTLGSGSSPRIVLEHIQAEILLSRYFYYANKPLGELQFHVNHLQYLIMSSPESLYHASTSGALVALAGLPSLGGSQSMGRPLQTEDGEQIRGLWRAIEMELVLSIARQGSVNLTGRTNEIDNITTPFPRPMQEYEMGMVRDLPLEYPVQQFKLGNGAISPAQECDESLSAKATLLWYWAHRNEQMLFQRHDTSVDMNATQQWFTHLSGQIQNFITSLRGPSSASLASISVHTKARAATLILHRSHWAAATLILALDVYKHLWTSFVWLPSSLNPVTFVDGTFGVAWVAASECLVQFVNDWDTQTVTNLRAALARMLAFEASCPKMKSSISKIRATLSKPLNL